MSTYIIVNPLNTTSSNDGQVIVNPPPPAPSNTPIKDGVTDLITFDNTIGPDGTYIIYINNFNDDDEIMIDINPSDPYNNPNIIFAGGNSANITIENNRIIVLSGRLNIQKQSITIQSTSGDDSGIVLDGGDIFFDNSSSTPSITLQNQAASALFFRSGTLSKNNSSLISLVQNNNTAESIKYYTNNVNPSDPDTFFNLSGTGSAGLTELPGGVCFAKESQVQTDQGLIDIEKLNPQINTIDNQKIVGISVSTFYREEVVEIKKDAFGLNMPTKDTIVSKPHKIFATGKTGSKKLRRAEKYVNGTSVILKRLPGKFNLYNVLFENYRKMVVNRLVCETLHPKRVIQYQQKYNRDMVFTTEN